MATSPPTISLLFNERLEKDLYYIRVYNAEGKSVTNSQAVMSVDQRTISMPLPHLPDGIYTVSYHIISADGHPVEQAYTLAIGKTTVQESPIPTVNHQHGGFALWANRALYYLSLLSITGWIFWGLVASTPSEAVRSEYNFWLKVLKHFYMFMLVGLGFVQMSELLDGNGFSGLKTGFLGTSFGLTWLISLIAAAAGYFLLRRWKWFDGIWIATLWTAEGINGHAVTFHPVVMSVSFDILHLAAAAIWAGGLLLILVCWKKDAGWTKKFIPLFSRGAMLSIGVLSVTGVLMTMVFVHPLSDLFRMEWGILILVKAFLLCLVVVVAIMIRSIVKKQDEDQHFTRWLKRDFTLMILIVIVVGGLTYTSPIPTNEPVTWLEYPDKMAITTSIQPNNPGVENSFRVQIDMQKPGDKLKQTEMWLTYLGKPAIAPIQVSLQKESEDQGKGLYLFDAVGTYLTLPGKWQVEIRVRDANDDETVVRKEITLYPVKRSS